MANFPKAEIAIDSGVAIEMKFRRGKRIRYSIDVVPSYWVNSPIDVASVRDERAYKGITTIWHCEYVRRAAEHNPQFHSLVMLLKDWNNEHDKPLKSYHIELLVASAAEYQEFDLRKGLEENLFECLRETAAFARGEPVFPVNWKYFDPEFDGAKFGDALVLVDPANPCDNVAESWSESEGESLERLANQAMSIVSQSRYRELLDPRETRREFWENHGVSA